MGIFAILALATTVSATPNTLFGSDTRFEPYAALVARGTTASSSAGVLGGLRLGVIANRSLVVGVAGFYSAIEPEAQTTSAYPQDRRLRFGYGGLELGYVLTATEHTRITARGLAGGGAVGHHPATGSGPYVGNSSFFVLEPGAEATVVLAGSITATVGFGYRWAYGVDLAGLRSGSNGRVTSLDGFDLDLAVGFSF